MPVTVYLIRHAETDKNVSKSNDLESSFVQEKNAYLNRAGKFQAMILGHYFRSIGIQVDAIYSSPLLRTFETAETVLKYINDEGDTDIIVEPRLLSSESKNHEKLKKGEKHHYVQNLGTKIKDRSKLKEMVVELMKDIVETFSEEEQSTVVLVTHNHVIDAFYNCFVEEGYYEKTGKKYKVPNCSVSCLKFDSADKCTVLDWNKTVRFEFKLE
jgi:broad specificity phosphatase PhoE